MWEEVSGKISAMKAHNLSSFRSEGFCSKTSERFAQPWCASLVTHYIKLVLYQILLCFKSREAFKQVGRMEQSMFSKWYFSLFH